MKHLHQLSLLATVALSPIITAIQPQFSHVPTITFIRGGGSTEPMTEEERQATIQSYDKLLKYRSDQQLLYQLRSTFLSELLASRGVPLPTVMGVSTVEGDKPPEKVDWDCAMSTVDDPKVHLLQIYPHVYILACLTVHLSPFFG